MIYILKILDKKYKNLYATLGFTSESDYKDVIKLVEDYYYTQKIDTKSNEEFYILLDYIKEEYNTVQIELHEVNI